MTQKANRRFFKVEPRLRSPASPFYGGQSGTGTVFHPCRYHSTNASCSSS